MQNEAQNIQDSCLNFILSKHSFHIYLHTYLENNNNNNNNNDRLVGLTADHEVAGSIPRIYKILNVD